MAKRDVIEAARDVLAGMERGRCYGSVGPRQWAEDVLEAAGRRGEPEPSPVQGEPAYFRRLRRAVTVLHDRAVKREEHREAEVYALALEWLTTGAVPPNSGAFSIVTAPDAGMWVHALLYTTPNARIPVPVVVVDLDGRPVRQS